MGGKGVAILVVDQLGQGRRIGFVADVPGLQPGQLGVGQAGARLGHLGQPEVDRITEDCGQQQRPVFVTVHRDCVDNNNSCGIG